MEIVSSVRYAQLGYVMLLKLLQYNINNLYNNN